MNALSINFEAGIEAPEEKVVPHDDDIGVDGEEIVCILNDSKESKHTKVPATIDKYPETISKNIFSEEQYNISKENNQLGQTVPEQGQCADFSKVISGNIESNHNVDDSSTVSDFVIPPPPPPPPPGYLLSSSNQRTDVNDIKSTNKKKTDPTEKVKLSLFNIMVTV